MKKKREVVSEISPSIIEEYGLYKEFARRLGVEHSKLFPMIAKKLMTPDQAKVVLALPDPPEEIAKKLSVTEKFVNDTLKEMDEKGVAVPTRKGYRMTGSVVQLHDGYITDKWVDILGPDYCDLWALYEITERYEDFRDFFLFTEYPVIKFMPKWQAIKDNPNLSPIEDIREVYKDRRLIAVNRCSCRRISWDCACQSPPEVCIFFDRIAEYQTARGNARIISYEEAMEIEDMSGDYSLVTVATNERKPTLVCHCGMDHCVELRTVLAGNNALHDPGLVDWKQYFYRTRYLAVIDEDKCNGCQICIEKCILGTIKMEPSGYLNRWKPWVDPDRCVGCGMCVPKCPKKAITLELVRPEQVYPETRALSGYGAKEERSAIYAAVKEGKVQRVR